MKLLLAHVIPACLVLAATPDAISAREVHTEATTIIRFEERDLGSEKKDMVPFTQYLGLDATKLADGNLSLHLHGWGRVDLDDTSYGDDKNSGDLSYGYLNYRFTKVNGDIRAGRFFVREGIVNEQVDGFSARTDLPAGFALSVFGGATVHKKDLYNETSDGKGDYLTGGRLSYRYDGLLELGYPGFTRMKPPCWSTTSTAPTGRLVATSGSPPTGLSNLSATQATTRKRTRSPNTGTCST